MSGLFDHVLVDEYQDTNAVQADILEAMGAEHGNVTAVGDDAQAIYGFRAASAQNMADFPDRFPGTVIVRLEQNYRSTPEILATANAVIGESAEVYPKELWSDRKPGSRPNLVVTMDETSGGGLGLRPSSRACANKACRSSSRQCCFAPGITPLFWNWSSHDARSRS